MPALVCKKCNDTGKVSVTRTVVRQDAWGGPDHTSYVNEELVCTCVAERLAILESRFQSLRELNGLWDGS